MSIENNKRIALNWMLAFNEHNLETLLSLYAEDAKHFSPKLKLREPATAGWLQGKASLRNWWQDSFNRLPALRYHLVNLIVNREQVLMEYLRTVPGDEDLMVAEILEIENGFIKGSRVYHS